MNHPANDEPIRLTTLPVPEAAMHVFIPVMDRLNEADEIWGIGTVDDYIATFEAIQAEVNERLANARALRDEGDRRA